MKMAVFWVVILCSLVEVYRRFSGMVADSIIRAMMEAASTSETSVNFYRTTQRYSPEDSHLRNSIQFSSLIKVFTNIKQISGRKRIKNKNKKIKLNAYDQCKHLLLPR
jgi:hypothetical protein